MQSGIATGFLCEQWLSAKVGRQFLSRDFLPSDTWAEAPRAPPPPARAAYIEPVLYTPFGFSDAYVSYMFMASSVVYVVVVSPYP